MNCGNHPDIPAAAYCRTCGKPLCTSCARDVRGIIYCEHCLAQRLEGSLPAAAAPGTGIPIVVNSGPNPALAGILGAIPFGVGAVYNGQYAKGLAHLVIFCLLIFGANTAHDPLDGIFGVGIAFFVLYQIFDAVRTARAIQMGQPIPDPFGLGRTFGAGEKIDTSKVPTAAIVLIALGALFLLQTSGFLDFSIDKFWPLLLIALGFWMMARRMGLVAPGRERPGRSAGPISVVWPIVLMTIGSLSLVENLHGPRWDRTWPVLILAIGLAKLIDHKTVPQFPLQPPPAAPGSDFAAEVPPPSYDQVKNDQVKNDEVKNG